MCVVLCCVADYRELSEGGYGVLVGPYSEALGGITLKLQIPYFSMSAALSVHASNLFHLMPDTRDIVRCILSLIKYYDWQQVAILYERSLRKLLF